eukprot:TRINITY_DN3191_c0_g1_i1.p1 TRINITY_DN3191_c0_g1~~TRINITY_DN3191_c0_g1_i1.p1  ORF type:complete len:283 (+),score=97.81 TRINITY_DN3191_c0_g1_i1:96-944(+)
MPFPHPFFSDSSWLPLCGLWTTVDPVPRAKTNNRPTLQAAVHQKAMMSKRELLDIRETDRLRREAMDRNETNEKEQARNAERDRKERAREKMEDLYVQKLDGIHKDRSNWMKEKKKHTQSCEEYVSYLGDMNRSERDRKSERRQNIQDDLVQRVQSAGENRVQERRRNEEFAKQRKAQEHRERQEAARLARDKALDYRQTHFENIVRTKKVAILEDADRKVTTSKVTARELETEANMVEQHERQLRNRIAEQKYALESMISSTPMATSTPRMVRKPPLSTAR